MADIETGLQFEIVGQIFQVRPRVVWRIRLKTDYSLFFPMLAHPNACLELQLSRKFSVLCWHSFATGVNETLGSLAGIDVIQNTSHFRSSRAIYKKMLTSRSENFMLDDLHNEITYGIFYLSSLN